MKNELSFSGIVSGVCQQEHGLRTLQMRNLCLGRDKTKLINKLGYGFMETCGVRGGAESVIIEMLRI